MAQTKNQPAEQFGNDSDRTFLKLIWFTLFGFGETEKCILQMLASAESEMYGLQMIEASSGKLKRGTVYVTLQRMREKGLISSRKQLGTSRRFYTITQRGRTYLDLIEKKIKV
ncbi:MAG: hypothetical protein FD167_576 [bacterium]|nr:MAG: hypothetical protein FD167_576 [bacterium]